MEYRLPDGTPYPKHLIPQTNYVGEIAWHDLLEKVPKVEVIRRADLSHQDTFNELGFLREDAIYYKRLPQLSLHMAGGGLQPEDIRFKQKGAAGDKWEAGQAVNVMALLPLVEVQEPWCAIFFRARDLHNQAFPYRKSGQDKAARKLAEAFGIFPDPETGDIPFEGKMQLFHDPTQLNYWHAELRFFDVEGKAVAKVDASWQKKAFRYALNQLLSHVAYAEGIQPTPALPQELYRLPARY